MIDVFKTEQEEMGEVVCVELTGKILIELYNI